MSPLQRFQRALPRSQFWRHLALVAGGTAAGQAASIVASPVLSRLYGPSDFGVLAVYASITGLIGAICAFSFHLAIPVATTDEDATKLLLLSLLSVILTSAVTAGCVLLLHAHVDGWVRVPGFEPFLFLVPLGVLGSGAYEALVQWASRHKAFGLIGMTSAGRSLLQVGAQLSGGWLRLGAGGLVTGQLLGQWSGTFQLARFVWKKDAAVVRTTTWGDVREVASKKRRYPMTALPGALLAALDAHSAPLLFAYFFGAATTGQFALGHRLLAIPFFLVGSSAQKVFAPAAALARQEGRLADETQQTFRRLLWLVFPMVFLLAISAPEVFTVVMGKAWSEAGTFMQWLSLRTCFTLLVFPLIPLVNVMEKQHVATLFSALQFAVRIGVIYIGSVFADAYLAVALLGICTGAMWLAYLGYILLLSGMTMKRSISLFVTESIVPALVASPVLAIKLGGASALTVTLAAGAAGAVALVLIMRRMRTESSSRPPQVAL